MSKIFKLRLSTSWTLDINYKNIHHIKFSNLISWHLCQIQESNLALGEQEITWYVLCKSTLLLFGDSLDVNVLVYTDLQYNWIFFHSQQISWKCSACNGNIAISL